MRKGAKVHISRVALQQLLKIKDDGQLLGVSYAADTDTFCLVIEAEDGKTECKVGSSTVVFENQQPENGNWADVQI